MEQNNIEKQIREKLNSRAIQPSSQAWDRLDAMLSVAEEKKTNRSFGWLYIAASILVFVSVGTFLYNQDGTKINSTETIVINENVKDSVKQNAVADKEIENAIPNSETPSLDKSNNESTAIINKKSTIAQSEKSFTQGVAERSEANQNNQNNQKTNSTSIINKEKAIEFQNSNDVALKNLPKIETTKEIVVSNTINSNQDLLVSSEEKNPKLNNISKVKINANSLLSQVDGELDLTFREKVFKKVNKNYKEVKVALANRNNQ
jgi:hypothetical protein